MKINLIIALCLVLGVAATNAVAESRDDFPPGPDKPQILKPVAGLLDAQTKLSSTAGCEALMIVTDKPHPIKGNADGTLGCPYMERSYSTFPKGINESLTRWGRYSGNMDARGQRLPNATEKINLIRWCYGGGRTIREWQGNAYLGEPSSDGTQCAQETQNYQPRVCYCIR